MALPTDSWILFDLVVAAVLAGAVGWERETAGKSAGFRTHIFVGMGAALFVALGGPMIETFERHGADVIRLDPIRLIEAVVAGISFLGAGTIFVSRGRQRVVGLTTAASLWVTAGIGIAAALERYFLAGGATVLALLILHVLLPLSERPDPDVEAETD